MSHGLTRGVVVAGMLALVLVSSGFAADEAKLPSGLPDDRLGVRTVPILLLSRVDVRADVGLTEPQAASVHAAIAELHARASRLRGKVGDEAVSGRKAVDDAQRSWIDTHLTPEQRDRLKQIDLQWEGPSALVSRPVVRDTLGLTVEQQAEIRKAIERRDAARGNLETRATAEVELARVALATLNETQRTRWKAMLGRPFAPQLAAGSPSTTSASARR
jgi:hypothetical protein